jgi:thioredoxin 1
MGSKDSCHLRAIGPEETLAVACAGAPLVLLLFGTACCAPCQTLKIKTERWLEERGGRRDNIPLDAIYIPLENNPKLAAQAGILSAPTLRLYAEGKLWAEDSGYFSLEVFLERAELIESRLHESLLSRYSLLQPPSQCDLSHASHVVY